MHARSYPIRGIVIGLMLSVPLWAIALYAVYGDLGFARRPAPKEIHHSAAAHGHAAGSTDADGDVDKGKSAN